MRFFSPTLSDDLSALSAEDFGEGGREERRRKTERGGEMSEGEGYEGRGREGEREREREKGREKERKRERREERR